MCGHWTHAAQRFCSWSSWELSSRSSATSSQTVRILISKAIEHIRCLKRRMCCRESLSGQTWIWDANLIYRLPHPFFIFHVDACGFISRQSSLIVWHNAFKEPNLLPGIACSSRGMEDKLPMKEAFKLGKVISIRGTVIFLCWNSCSVLKQCLVLTLVPWLVYVPIGVVARYIGSDDRLAMIPDPLLNINSSWNHAFSHNMQYLFNLLCPVLSWQQFDHYIFQWLLLSFKL